MADRYDRAQLEVFCKQVFVENPHLDRIYATEDGQLFGERHKSDASNYARQTQQELILIERLKHDSLASQVADTDDPMTRDVAAIMLALTCTEDKARELIQEHKGNASAAVKTATATIDAVQKPAATAPKRTRKPSTPKTPDNGTT
jgi:type VI protein secretion system component VasA